MGNKYILLLILGGIGGNLLSAFMDTTSLGVGASTSLYAVLGALLVKIYSNILAKRANTTLKVSFFAMAFTLLNGFISSGNGVDVWGHLGGFIVGLYLASFYLLDFKKMVSISFLIGFLILVTAGVFIQPIFVTL